MAVYLASFDESLQARANLWPAQATATVFGKLSVNCFATPLPVLNFNKIIL